jgi:hypothetical protein
MQLPPSVRATTSHGLRLSVGQYVRTSGPVTVTSVSSSTSNPWRVPLSRTHGKAIPLGERAW